MLKMKAKTILVTGSAGFIGFHVSKRLLDDGETVIGVDNLNDYYDISLKKSRNEILLANKSYCFYKIDVTDYDELQAIFKKHKIDKICHLAAYSGVRYSLTNPFIYEEVNLKGFLNILELSRNFGVVDLVYASSSSVYGNNPMPKGGFSEGDRVDNPISLYAATKKADELIAHSYHHLFGLRCVGLRFFNVYGPWGRPDAAYFKFTKAILEGKEIDIYNYGKMKRDFTYIDDIVDGVISALKKTYPYLIANLGNSRMVDLKYFIKCVENELGKKAKKRYLPMQMGDIPESHANIDVAKKKLDFSPKIKVKEGLRRFIAWYRDYYRV